MTTRATMASQDSDYYDPYIRIPSDLFGERRNRQPPSILLPSAHTSGRSAGVYPPPRPLHHPEPWTLQGGRGGKDQRLRLRSSPSLKRRRHLLGNPDSSNRNLEERFRQFRYYQCPQCRESLFSWKEKEEEEKEKQQKKRHQFSLTYPLLLSRRTPAYSPSLYDLDLKSERHRDDLENFMDLPSKVNHVHFHPEVLTSLPHVLCTSPCTMHPRDLQPPRRDLDLLYSTSCHGGKVGVSKVKVTGGKFYKNDAQDRRYVRQDGCPHKNHQHSASSVRDRREKDKDIRNYTKENTNKDNDFRNSARYKEDAKDASRSAGVEALDDSSSPNRDNRTMVLRAQRQLQYQLKLFRARLPESLPSKDVVLSWLKHGSAPASESHFPDLT